MADVGEEQPPLETAPLLGVSPGPPPQHSDEPESSQTTDSRGRNVIILIFMIVIICDFGGVLGYAPQLQLFEKIICDEHYASVGPLGALDGLDPSRCKSQAVQAELALINGWKDTFETLPGTIERLCYSEKMGVLTIPRGRTRSGNTIWRIG